MICCSALLFSRLCLPQRPSSSRLLTERLRFSFCSSPILWRLRLLRALGLSALKLLRRRLFIRALHPCPAFAPAFAILWPIVLTRAAVCAARRLGTRQRGCDLRRRRFFFFCVEGAALERGRGRLLRPCGLSGTGGRNNAWRCFYEHLFSRRVRSACDVFNRYEHSLSRHYRLDDGYAWNEQTCWIF